MSDLQMGWLIGHLIGDYLLQNDWMAQGKKQRHWPCFVHVASYTAVVMLLTQWPLWAAAVVFIPHYAIDRWQFVPWYMRTIGQSAFMRSPAVRVTADPRDPRWQATVEYVPGLGPWSIIVVDNCWHLVCLFATQLIVEYGR